VIKKKIIIKMKTKKMMKSFGLITTKGRKRLAKRWQESHLLGKFLQKSTKKP